MNRKRISLILAFAAAPLLAQAPFRIATVAGQAYDPTGDGGLAAKAGFAVSGIAVRGGNLYLADGSRVRRISPDGLINTVVGLNDPVVHLPIAGFSGDGGPALGAMLNGTQALEFDSAGNLYIADAGNNCIRKVTAHIVGGVPQPIDGTEIITTYAGTPVVLGNSNGAGVATAATMNAPHGMAFDLATGALYIADFNNNNIRKVDAAGTISTFAGTGAAGSFGDNGPAINAQLHGPIGVAVDPATGDVYVADLLNNRLRKISGGVITTVAGTGTSSAVGGLNEGGAALGANIHPIRVRVAAGAIYLADSGVNEIRKIAGGVITTVAGSGLAAYTGPLPPVGDGGLAVNARLSGVTDLIFDAAGGYYVADASNTRIRFAAALSAETVFGQTVAAGMITTIAGPPGAITFAGDGGPALGARFFGIGGVTSDTTGNLYLSDSRNAREREIDLTRTIRTIAGTGVAGFSAGPAASAQIQPGAVVFHNGSLYFTNGGSRVVKDTGGNLALVTNTSGATSPPPADGSPALNGSFAAGSIAFDASGNLYIADNTNLRIWKVDTAGNLTAVAGKGTVNLDGTVVTSLPAGQVLLSGAGSLALDPQGNLYFTDGPANRILKIAANGVNAPLDASSMVTMFAGAGAVGFEGDSGPAIAAKLNSPTGLVFDPAGNLYFSDAGNYRVRKVDAHGTISTVAGDGTASYAGDGGLATQAAMRTGTLAFDPFGNLYMADGSNMVLRVLDNVPPTITGMPAQNCSLWPPNGKMVKVATVSAADTGAGIAPGTFNVTGASNEGSSSEEISVTPNGLGGYNIALQADRAGNGTGRVYSLQATAADRAGNVTTMTATCTVPHDQGK